MDINNDHHIEFINLIHMLEKGEELYPLLGADICNLNNNYYSGNAKIVHIEKDNVWLITTNKIDNEKYKWKDRYIPINKLKYGFNEKVSPYIDQVICPNATQLSGGWNYFNIGKWMNDKHIRDNRVLDSNGIWHYWTDSMYDDTGMLSWEVSAYGGALTVNCIYEPQYIVGAFNIRIK